MNEFFGWFASAWAVAGDVWADYGDQAVIGAGAVGMIVALVAIRKAVKGEHHDEVAANIGVILFLVVTTEGMWEVVHKQLEVEGWLAVLMFAAFDVVIYSQGKKAIRKLRENPAAQVGHHLFVIWVLSVAASITVSFASDNVPTWFFRFFAPLVAGLLWTQQVLELRKRDGQRQESDWIWTPTRLMIRWGLKKPGKGESLNDLLRNRRIEQIVNAATLVWLARPVEGVTPDPKLVEKAGKAAVRLRKLGKKADPATVAAAREQLRIAVEIQDELFAGLGQAVDRVDDDTRDALTEFQMNTRETANRLRSGHWLSGPVTHGRSNGDVDRGWSNPMVRLPQRVVDQLRSTGADSGDVRDASFDPWSLAEPVRDASQPAPVDASPGDVPAVRQSDPEVTRHDAAGLPPGVPPLTYPSMAELRQRHNGDATGDRPDVEEMTYQPEPERTRRGPKPTREERLADALRLVEVEDMSARAAALQVGLNEQAVQRYVRRHRTNGHAVEVHDA